MSTSTFFNNYENSQEQGLMEDLIREAIQIYGIDFTYILRDQTAYQDLFTEDSMSVYKNAYEIEMLVRNTEGFEGDGQFLSQFGPEIRDRMVFTVSARSFAINVGDRAGIERPREGDLIYYPLNKRVFQIRYVENKPIFYPLGSLPTYELYCDLFEYSNEKFDTGEELIDEIQNKFTTNIYDYGIMNENGKFLVNEDGLVVTHGYNFDRIDPMEINTELSDAKAGIIDFSESNPFGEIS